MCIDGKCGTFTQEPESAGATTALQELALLLLLSEMLGFEPIAPLIVERFGGCGEPGCDVCKGRKFDEDLLEQLRAAQSPGSQSAA